MRRLALFVNFHVLHIRFSISCVEVAVLSFARGLLVSAISMAFLSAVSLDHVSIQAFNPDGKPRFATEGKMTKSDLAAACAAEFLI